MHIFGRPGTADRRREEHRLVAHTTVGRGVIRRGVIAPGDHCIMIRCATHGPCRRPSKNHDRATVGACIARPAVETGDIRSAFGEFATSLPGRPMVAPTKQAFSTCWGEGMPSPPQIAGDLRKYQHSTILCPCNARAPAWACPTIKTSPFHDFAQKTWLPRGRM